MNRLILIGNGFDLAHGLKTSYNDFIEHLWYNIYKDIFNIVRYHQCLYKECKDQYVEDDNKLIKLNTSEVDIWNVFMQILSSIDQKRTIFLPSQNIELTDDELHKAARTFMEMVKPMMYKEPNNIFFNVITENYINKNWSDIEADYYKCLIANKDNEAKIARLNQDFDQIKELLRVYLSGLEKPKEIKEIDTLIHSPIKMINCKITYREAIKYKIRERIKDILEEDIEKRWLIKAFEAKHLKLNFNDNRISVKERDIDIALSWIMHSENDENLRLFFIPQKVMMLNFNYTNTENLYIDKEIGSYIYRNLGIQINHIHGTLDDDDNHMIFGYGDEEAEEYKELEKIETKGLLENVKSINYLKTSNYRDLEQFIESDFYQIYIMGMSCGMADRTILRKLFQHKNCISIKPFYYQKLDKDGNPQWDNYTEIVQNISRCFNDKDLLRSTVVNKRYCTPLPQIEKTE